MQPSEQEKQLTTYADGITAFCVLQALAFIYALAGNEFFYHRVVRTDGAIACTSGIIIGTGLYCFLVSRCATMIGKLHLTPPLPAGIEKARIWIIVVAGLVSAIALWLVKLNPIK